MSFRLLSILCLLVVAAFSATAPAQIGDTPLPPRFQPADDLSTLLAEADQLERRLSDCVNEAYGLTPEEIENFPHKNVVVRALGMKDTVQVDVNRLDPKVGDYYLLCSDGLSGMISDEEIRDITLQSDDLETACESLVNAANAAGGTDNITVTIVQFMGD